MELFLDSMDFKEIEEGLSLGILSGLTTTPTFMYRHGVKDVDKAIVKLSGMVPSLHIEAIGKDYDETMAEARKIQKLPLKKKPVFKIPISDYGMKACRTLIKEGYDVNMHLVYTLNQAYLAMESGATYVCILVGRLHDQGHDAFSLLEKTISAVKRYDYKTKIMIASVRHPEHVRQSLILGVDACTLPWNVLKILYKNRLTNIGAEQFLEHNRLMTVKVREVIRKKNPVCSLSDSLIKAIVEMTESRLGAVSVVDDKGDLVGILTDGDLRRHIKDKGDNISNMKMSGFKYKKPFTIGAEAFLYEAVNAFTKHEYDNIIIVENKKPIGMIDVQDFVKMRLLG